MRILISDFTLTSKYDIPAKRYKGQKCLSKSYQMIVPSKPVITISSIAYTYNTRVSDP